MQSVAVRKNAMPGTLQCYNLHSFVILKVPLDTDLARFYARHLLLGFVYRSLGDAELSSPTEDLFVDFFGCFFTHIYSNSNAPVYN